MSFIKKIFGVLSSETIEDLRKSLSCLEGLKKGTISTTLEYKRIQRNWAPCKELISKGQATGSLIGLDKKYEISIKNLEETLQELSNKQDKIKKGITSQIIKNPALLPLLFVDDFISENRYNEIACSLVKAHKEGKISNEQLKKLTVYKKEDLTEKEQVYVKDDRTQYADTIIVDDENRILFVIRNKQDDFCPAGYCLPGGHIEEGETPREAAKRELQEETGIEFELHEFVPCGEYVDEKSHIYYFLVHSNVEPVVLQEEEQQQWEKVLCTEISTKPLIMNLQNNLEHLVAVPKTVPEDAQKVYFDGKNFKKGKENLACIYGLHNCSAIIDAEGKCSIYEEKDEIEKAMRSHLTPKKVFVTRGGKTFLTTVYVNAAGEIVKEKEGAKELEEHVKEDVGVGDLIEVTTVRGKREGIVECLVKTKEGAYIGFRTSEGKYTEAYLKSIHDLKVKSGSAKPVVKETPSSTSVKDIASVPDFSTLPTLGGSSETYLYEKDGKKYFIKKERPGKSGQLKSECLADKVYNAMGFKAPVSDFHDILDEKSGEVFACKISEYLEYQELRAVSGALKEKARKNLRKGFALDCLLANWDVIGADADNILVSPEGEVVRIDNGSAFEYRAKGSLKPESEFLKSTEVVELNSMRTAGKAVPAVLDVFGSLTDLEVAQQINDITSNVDTLVETLTKNNAPVEVVTAITNRVVAMDKWAGLVKIKAEEEKEAERKRLEEASKWDRPTKDPSMLSVVTEEYFSDWDSFEMDGNPELKESLKKGILEKERARNSNYEKTAKELGMTVGAYKAKLQQLAEDFVRVTYPGIVLHTAGSHEAFSKVFKKGGRFKSLFETRTGCGCTSTSSRASYEKRVFGFMEDVDVNKDKRPIYGCASNNARGFYGGKDSRSAAGYGDVFVEVKRDKALRSATLTMGDSLNSDDRYFPVPFGKPHFTMFSHCDYPLDARETIASIEGYIRGSESRIDNQGSYIEMQYHNQLLQDDVEAIHLQLGKGRATDMSISKVVQNLIDLSKETGKAHKVDVYVDRT